MTDKEKHVIECACNLAESVVAGRGGLPRPMNIAVNSLHHAVWDLVKERGWQSPKDGCSNEFLEEEKKYWQEVEDNLRGVKA